MLNDNTIKKLQEIIKDQGEEISFEVASQIANQLFTYYDTLAKIYHEMRTENNN
jgi:flagellin-specific chaperone FliS